VSADFDKDGAPDIAVNTAESRVAVLMNAQWKREKTWPRICADLHGSESKREKS
jgi:hypothetical protein